jgi:group I intron endonuclease
MITYRAVNTKNGKWYVGSTINFKQRKSQHLLSKAKSPFHNALRRSPGDFVWEILEDDDREDRLAEQLILSAWFGSLYCYNLSASAIGFDSEGARKAGLRSAAKMDSAKRKKINEHMHLSKNEEGKSLLAVRMGRAGAATLHSRKDENGKSVIGVQMARIVNEKKHAERDEFGRSIAGKNNYFGKMAKPIKLTNIETGEELIFPSSADAALILGLNARYLRKVASGLRAQHGGYCAEFVEG